MAQVPRAIPPPPAERASTAAQASIDPVVEIRNLPAGRHVLELEGEVVATADSAAWAAGVAVDVQGLALRRIHKTIQRKNQLWHYRYRAVNGEYIYGRRDEPFGVNNFPGEFRRLEMMVEAAEHQVWRQVKDLLYLHWRIHPAAQRAAASRP